MIKSEGQSIFDSIGYSGKKVPVIIKSLKNNECINIVAYKVGYKGREDQLNMLWENHYVSLG